MQSEEQRLIDGLFTRLQQAETQSAPRDADAEARIVHHLQQQPQAPYYMAQTILIQEAAIKQLNQRLQALEGQLAQREQEASHKPESGGFLAGRATARLAARVLWAAPCKLPLASQAAC